METMIIRRRRWELVVCEEFFQVEIEEGADRTDPEVIHSVIDQIEEGVYDSYSNDYDLDTAEPADPEILKIEGIEHGSKYDIPGFPGRYAIDEDGFLITIKEQ